MHDVSLPSILPIQQDNTMPEEYIVLVFSACFCLCFVFVCVLCFCLCFLFLFIVWTHLHLEIMGPPTICMVWNEAALFIPGRVL